MTLEANAESLKHMGRERTNVNRVTVGMRQLRWEEECQNMRFLFVTLGATSFGNSWEEEQGTIAVAREAPALRRKQHAYFQRYQHDRGPIGSLKLHC